MKKVKGKKSLVGWMNKATGTNFHGYGNLKFESVKILPDTDESYFGIRFPILWKNEVVGFKKVRITIEELP